MTIDNVLEILEKHKLRIPSNVFYELKADIVNFEEPTTKNDLAVDCISRADAIKAMQDKAKELKNEDTINGLCGAVAILYDLPTVTPQELRIGHWINTANPRMSDNIVCSECGFNSIADYKYCPNCGADMREVEECQEKNIFIN